MTQMNKVQLFVYDLSGGLARSMSLALTGRQIDGIWHTSVVVFGKEIFYGQGISITRPGQSHHGRPQQVVDCGETAIDEETFNDYLHEIREHYSADKYHLLDFNCNSFTNDCVGFLTGGSIPSYIKDLPTDFLSTPFGAALRPQIDAMYRRPTQGGPQAPAVNRGAAASLLQAVAAQAQSPSPAVGPSNPATSSLAGPLQICTNPASLRSILATHPAVVVFFTSATCPPCNIVKPVFEDLAYQKASPGVAFVKVDMGVGMGGQIGMEWKVRATPTFLFFHNQKQIGEVKGANVPELRTQVDLMLFTAFPPHPHTKLNLKVLPKLPLQPILYTQVPALDALTAKLTGFVDGLPGSSGINAAQIKSLLSTHVVPYLKARNSPDAKSVALSPTVNEQWRAATIAMAKALRPTELFPLIDLWRVSILDPSMAAACAARGNSDSDVLQVLIGKAREAMDSPGARNLILTALRLSANSFASDPLGRHMLDAQSGVRGHLGALLVGSLLNDDNAVRTAAASVAFNVGGFYQRPRVERAKLGVRGPDADGTDVDGEWAVEMVSALIEALDRESTNEDVVHRLLASLVCFCYLSPAYETTLKPLLDVLQAGRVLETKKGLVSKAEVAGLLQEMRTLVQE